MVLPLHFRSIILKQLHDDLGHQGRDRTLSLVRSRFYWPGLENDVEEKIKNCGRCIRRKTPVKPSAELINITSSQPMELLCIDFLSLERSKGGHEHNLVVTDHFTCYAQAFPTRNQSAKTSAKILFENFVVHYMVFRLGSIVIREEILKVALLRNCVVLRVCISPGPLHITLWEMEWSRDLTRPF